VISPLQAEAARRWRWLRPAYLHRETVRQTLADAGVPSDAAPGPTRETLDLPDALLGGQQPVDVVPDTEVSVHAHLDRAGITSPAQLLTYPPYDDGYMAEVFA
jgi:hypothetical protein